MITGNANDFAIISQAIAMAGICKEESLQKGKRMMDSAQLEGICGDEARYFCLVGAVSGSDGYQKMMAFLEPSMPHLSEKGINFVKFMQGIMESGYTSDISFLIADKPVEGQYLH